MPEGIAGDQSPPDISDRIGPTFGDVYSFIERVVRVGTRACQISSEAPWLLRVTLVLERASSRKRTSENPTKIEPKYLEIAACEVLREVAVAALPEYPDEGPRLIGEAQGYRNAPLKRRYEGAARARNATSGKSWQNEHRLSAIAAMADVLYRAIYAPETVAEVSQGGAMGPM